MVVELFSDGLAMVGILLAVCIGVESTLKIITACRCKCCLIDARVGEELKKLHAAVVADRESFSTRLAKAFQHDAADVAKITLPPNLVSLQRSALVELSLRINPGWSVNNYWTRSRLVERLQSWDRESMLSLRAKPSVKLH